MKEAMYGLALCVIGFISLSLLSTIAVFIWDDVPSFIMIFNCFLTYFIISFVKPRVKKFMKIK